MPRSFVPALVLLAASLPASAHEYWIEPDRPMPDPGTRVTAEMRVGQDFSGPTFPYLSHRFQSFTVHDATGSRPVEGLEGDSPSVRIPNIAPGLTIVTYHSSADTATFDTLADFADYLAYEGLGHVAERHRAAGLPDADFSEDYVRCAKALIQAGPVGPDDRDRATGLPAELVALDNPFAAGRGRIAVRMLWQGAPVADRQVAVFLKPVDGSGVVRTLHVTGADGKVTLDTSRPGRYLLNAVHMERTGRKTGAVWKSHWASLTFSVPEN